MSVVVRHVIVRQVTSQSKFTHPPKSDTLLSNKSVILKWTLVCEGSLADASLCSA